MSFSSLRSVVETQGSRYKQSMIWIFSVCLFAFNGRDVGFCRHRHSEHESEGLNHQHRIFGFHLKVKGKGKLWGDDVYLFWRRLDVRAYVALGLREIVFRKRTRECTWVPFNWLIVEIVVETKSMGNETFIWTNGQKKPADDGSVAYRLTDRFESFYVPFKMLPSSERVTACLMIVCTSVCVNECDRRQMDFGRILAHA